jgi:hypothetical protein
LRLQKTRQGRRWSRARPTRARRPGDGNQRSKKGYLTVAGGRERGSRRGTRKPRPSTEGCRAAVPVWGAIGPARPADAVRRAPCGFDKLTALDVSSVASRALPALRDCCKLMTRG